MSRRRKPPVELPDNRSELERLLLHGRNGDIEPAPWRKRMTAIFLARVFERKTYKQIAQEYGVSVERTSKIAQKACYMLHSYGIDFDERLISFNASYHRHQRDTARLLQEICYPSPL